MAPKKIRLPPKSHGILQSVSLIFTTETLGVESVDPNFCRLTWWTHEWDPSPAGVQIPLVFCPQLDQPPAAIEPGASQSSQHTCNGSILDDFSVKKTSRVQIVSVVSWGGPLNVPLFFSIIFPRKCPRVLAISWTSPPCSSLQAPELPSRPSLQMMFSFEGMS